MHKLWFIKYNACYNVEEVDDVDDVNDGCQIYDIVQVDNVDDVDNIDNVDNDVYCKNYDLSNTMHGKICINYCT